MKKKIYLLYILLVSLVFSACSFAASFIEEDSTSISFPVNEITIDIGAMEVLDLTVSEDQNTVNIEWDYDASILYARADNYGIIFTGLKAGTTIITATYSPTVKARCIVNVTSDTYMPTVTNPYVYSSTDFVSLKNGETEKVCATLFGGTNADLEGFSWSIDKPSIASIVTEGNYCWITGENTGTARVTAKHSKAAYGFSILVDVSNNGTTVPYITTTENIVTMNLSLEEASRDVTFSLVNPRTGDLGSYSFSLVDENGTVLVNPPCVINSTNGNICNISAKTVGNCYLRCHHPDASYDFDVLVRVVKDAELTYIEPSETFFTLSDSESHSVTVELVNYKGTSDPNSFKWYFSDNASQCLSYSILNGNGKDTGNEISFTAKKSGTVSATVTYPGCPERKIVIIVRDVNSEAASATTYITTSQNYITLKKGESISVEILLKDCVPGDIDNLSWGIVNTADDGTSRDVISWIKGNGKYTSKSSNRSTVMSYSEQGYCVIRGENPGTAYIDISHPRAIYPTRINVKVEGDTPAVKESFLSIPASSIIRMTNGDVFTASVLFSGSGSADEIQWNLNAGSLCSISPNGSSCAITAPSAGSGINQHTLTATHRYSKYPVKFTVLTSDAGDDVSDYILKSIFTTEQTCRRIPSGGNQAVSVSCDGITDYSKLKWEVIEGTENVSLVSNGNTEVYVYGVKEGRSVLKVSYPDCNDLYFTVDVYDMAVVDEAKDVYLSTTSNVLYFPAVNEAQTVNVTLSNILEYAYSDIKWLCNTTQFEIAANGNSATISALNLNVTGILTVSHPKSKNSLTIYLRSGKQFEYINEDFTYITADKETIELVEGGKDGNVTVKLNHTEAAESPDDNKYFTFATSSPEICEISYITGTNYCYLKPAKQGVATITVRNTKYDVTKEVMVIVNKAEYSDKMPYLTTSNNVITVLEGDSAAVTASLVNSSSVDFSKWHWSVTGESKSIVQIAGNNGNSALIKGLKSGQAYLTLTHDLCDYALKFIVIVLASDSVATVPYITSNSTIVNLVKGESFNITASIIGGNSPSDTQYFNWSISDGAIALINPSAENCTVKGLQGGMAYITIKNSRYADSYSKTVLVIVEDTAQANVYITVNSSIIKLTPDDRGLTDINAVLNGGEATDGSDFIWWADDPKLLAMTSVADRCSISPTGRSGTTKIHVKHPKASKTCDILVLISEFDNFEFSEPAMKITSGRLYFASLNVPAMENSFTVEYSSDDESICYIDGGNYIAYLAGGKAGTTTVWATMKNSSNEVLATAQMLVSVSVQNELVPVISVGESIINTEIGASQIIAANISGAGIDENEKYNLIWQVTSAKVSDGITFINNDMSGKFVGPDCQLNFNKDGQYIVTVTHEASGAASQILINVAIKGELRMTLDPDYTVVYREDGTFEVKATIENGSAEDYSNIEWSCLKPQGNQIVRVSKQKGRSCSVTPVKSGTTTVFAKLPNGLIAKCIVTVQNNAEIRIATGAVHVIPGRTIEVDYYTNPADASLMWIRESNIQSSSLTDTQQEYFSYTIDTVAHKIYITGEKEYQGKPVGKLKAVMTSDNCPTTPTLDVYVEYNIEVNVYAGLTGDTWCQTLNNHSAASSSKQYFRVETYPSNLLVDVTPVDFANCKGNNAAENLLSIGREHKMEMRDDFDFGVNTFTITPKGEGECKIVVTAYLEEDTNKAHSNTYAFDYKCYYDSYNIVVNTVSEKAGAFSQWNGTDLYLGDGEETFFYLECTDENNNCSIELSANSSNTQYINYNIPDWNGGNFTVSKENNMSDPSKTMYKIKAGNDYVKPMPEDTSETKVILNKNIGYMTYQSKNYFIKKDSSPTAKVTYRWHSVDGGGSSSHGPSELMVDFDYGWNYQYSIHTTGFLYDDAVSGQIDAVSDKNLNWVNMKAEDFFSNYTEKTFNGTSYSKHEFERAYDWNDSDNFIAEKQQKDENGNYYVPSKNWINKNNYYLPYRIILEKATSNASGVENPGARDCSAGHPAYRGWINGHKFLNSLSKDDPLPYSCSDEKVSVFKTSSLKDLKVSVSNTIGPTLYHGSNAGKNGNCNDSYYYYTSEEKNLYSFEEKYSMFSESTDLPYIVTLDELKAIFTFPDITLWRCDGQHYNVKIKGGLLLEKGKDYNIAPNINTTVLNPEEPAKTISFDIRYPNPNKSLEQGKYSITVKYQVRECEAYKYGEWTPIKVGNYMHWVHN